jgi:hypothetical protein
MDAVVKGLIGGSAISLILFGAGLVTLSTGFGETMKNPTTVGIWLVTLTALMCGQLYITFSITQAFAEAPSQTK